MLVLGHVGFAAAAGRAIDRRTDLRWLAVASLLPDLIDKPLALLPATNGATRLVGHSALALAVFASIALSIGRRRAAPLVAAYALHLLLDRMWEDPFSLAWPLLGMAPTAPPSYADRWTHRALEVASLRLPDCQVLWCLLGEVVGLALLARASTQRERVRQSPLSSRA